MSVAIVCQALFSDDTPITGLYVTLDDLQNPHLSYVGFTDKEGKISEWYEKTQGSMVPVSGNINSAWRMGFYVGLVHHGNGGLFNHIYTDFFVKECHHPITLCLAPEEYSVKHRPEMQLAPPSWDHLEHPQPLPPGHLVLKSEATLTQTPQLTAAIGHPETPHIAVTGTPWQDLDAAPRDGRLTSPDFIALLEDRLDELDSYERPSSAGKPSRKRKRDDMEEDIEAPKPRRSERLSAKSKLH
jgi:hypothetical protein